MDGKLIFDENYYSLEVVHERIGNMIVGSSDHELSKMINQPFKLSINNCEAVANGYDLDELAETEAKKRHDWNKHRDTDIYNQSVWEDAELIKIGFQKALEILGDKKFSEEDMYEAFRKAKSYDEIPNHEGVIVSFNYSKEEIIQSLQQTEWDVEIEMESNLHIGEVVDESYPKDFPLERPMLDANGCIILKRK